MIIIDDIEQGSPEWYATRCGVLSSSEFKRIITLEGDRSADTGIIPEKAIERITKQPYSTFESYDMRRGTALQPEATTSYEFLQGVTVRQIGFCFLNEDRNIGASTDGLINSGGVFEVKAPKGTTHVKYTFDNDALVKEYKQQVQGELYVTEREWVDLMSYYPGLSSVIIRVYRDEPYIKKMAQFLKDAVEQIDEFTERLRRAQQ